MGKACNVLSIDGCGFRGRTQLLVLDQLMKDVGVALGRNPDDVPRPCEVFDLICGTATGGLIAILVGRLGMSCKKAINAYDDLEGKVFSPNGEQLDISDILNRQEPFDTTDFQAKLKEIVEYYSDQNAQKRLVMRADDKHTGQCKTFVTIANRRAAVDEDAYRIRSYERRTGHDTEIDPGHIWLIQETAIGATSCPQLFQPLEVTNSEIGGSFLVQAANMSGFSNPSMIAYLDALDEFGKDAKLTLVSLGMGLRKRHSYGVLEKTEIDAMVKQLGISINDGVNKERLVKFFMQTQAVATTAQIKHLRVGNLMRRRPNQHYYRFDPPRDGRTSPPNAGKPPRPPRPFVLVDYLQDDTIENITRDFFRGGYAGLQKDAVKSLMRTVAKASQWEEHRGYDCDVDQVEKWTITDPTQIMLKCYEWEKKNSKRISCFAIDPKTKETDVIIGPITLTFDGQSTTYVRVLLDDQWEFFPRQRANEEWEDLMDEQGYLENPIGAVQAAQPNPNIKAFNSKGYYTTSNVNLDKVDMIEDYTLSWRYQGTWIRTA